MSPAGCRELLKKHYSPHPKAYETLIRHSEAVARMAVEIGSRMSHLSPDVAFIEEAALLHDIGIFLCNAPKLGCTGQKPYICHGWLGYELLIAEDLPRHAAVCMNHVGVGLSAMDIKANRFPIPAMDMLPTTIEEKIVCYADKFFSKDGSGDRPKPLEAVRQSIAAYGMDKLATFDSWSASFGII